MRRRESQGMELTHLTMVKIQTKKKESHIAHRKASGKISIKYPVNQTLCMIYWEVAQIMVKEIEWIRILAMLGGIC